MRTSSGLVHHTSPLLFLDYSKILSAVFNDDRELVADTLSAGPCFVCIMSCTKSVPCRSFGECVCSVLSCCGVLMMLLPIGVDNDTGIIVINCSCSVSVVRFVE